MLAFLRSWIINIVTISIILILFEIIIPTGKLKKIINLVSGFVLLIAVINPFLALKNESFKLSDQSLIHSVYIDKKEIETSSKMFENKQMEQIIEVYKSKLVSRIQEETNKLEGVQSSTVDVDINEDYTINRVYVEIKKGKKVNGNITINTVEPVKSVDIKSATIKNSPEKNEEVLDIENKKIADLVKDNLNKSLEIHKDSIVVSVI